MISRLWPFRNATIIKTKVDALVGITNTLRAGGHEFETHPRDFSLLHNIHTISKTHPTDY